MQGRRYSGNGTAPELVFPNKNQVQTYTDRLRLKRRNTWLQPVPNTALSGTSEPRDCFVFRKNSEKYQRFLLNYAYNIVTAKVLSGEV